MSRDPAFDGFVRASHAPLLRAAVLLTSDHHHAQDLVQETYARLAQRWPALVRQGVDPFPYARTVLYRLAVDRWRARARRPESPIADVEPYADASPRAAAPPAGTEDRVVLLQALARLTPKQRAVLVLRYWEDRTEVETAALLGCSVNTVKSQAPHALQRLRDLAPDLLADFAPDGAGAGVRAEDERAREGGGDASGGDASGGDASGAEARGGDASGGEAGGGEASGAGVARRRGRESR